MTALLEIEDLRVAFPSEEGEVHAVRGVSLSIEAGETLCLVGESGSGKTMTGLAALGLLPPGAVLRAARMQFDGRALPFASERAMEDIRGAHVAMVFQNPTAALNPALTVGDQLVETWRRHRGGTPREARHEAAAALRRAGIPDPEHRMRQYAHQLSGGLCQRAMIALALICDPALLIADEPTTALDVTTQAQILRLLQSLQRESGMGLLLITHDLRIVSRMADRVAVMYGGEIVELAPRRDLFRRPAHPYTRALLQSLPDAAPGDRLAAIPGAPPRIVGDLQGCAFAPRCAQATPACAAAIPLRPAGDHRFVRCIAP